MHTPALTWGRRTKRKIGAAIAAAAVVGLAAPVAGHVLAGPPQPTDVHSAATATVMASAPWTTGPGTLSARWT